MPQGFSLWYTIPNKQDTKPSQSGSTATYTSQLEVENSKLERILNPRAYLYKTQKTRLAHWAAHTKGVL